VTFAPLAPPVTRLGAVEMTTHFVYASDRKMPTVSAAVIKVKIIITDNYS